MNITRLFTKTILGVVLLATACTAKNSDSTSDLSLSADSIHSVILAERIDMISAMVEAGKAGKLCYDTESFWAYEQADSILNSIDKTQYMNAMAKTYVANSYVFYGTSYVNMILAMAQGGDADDFQFPSFEGYRQQMDADSLSWFDLSTMEAWSVYGLSFMSFVVGMDDYASQRLDESLYGIASINAKELSLKDEKIFTYAAVLNAKCYFNNIIRFYYTYYAEKHNTAVPKSVEKTVIDIATELESFPLDKLENGEIEGNELLLIQLKCAKLTHQITQMWVEQL